MNTLPPLSMYHALELQGFLLKAAESDGLPPVAICIVDARCALVTAVTMDDVKMASIGTAYGKAVTAVRFQRDTIEFRFRRDPQTGAWKPDTEQGWDLVDIAAASNVNGSFIPWAGGAVIYDESANIVGAVGVSNRTEQEDHDLAEQRPPGFGASLYL